MKAIGAGVGYKLDDVEFQHTSWDNIYVKVAGKELKDWKFWLSELGQNYSVSFHNVLSILFCACEKNLSTL